MEKLLVVIAMVVCLFPSCIKPPASHVVRVGEKCTIGDYSITVNNIRFADTLPLTPQNWQRQDAYYHSGAYKNKHFIIINTTYTNTGNTISAVPCYGVRFSPHGKSEWYNDSKTINDTTYTLSPNQTQTVDISYNIPSLLIDGVAFYPYQDINTCISY